MSDTILNGDRVILRPMLEADLPRLLEIVLQPGVREWWPDYDAVRLRADTLDSSEDTSLAIEFDGSVIGLLIYAEEMDAHYRSASLDITLDAGCLGQGLGPDALRAAARFLFAERGHHRITIDPAVDNARAIAAYTKVGFKPVGVMRRYEMGLGGVWHDNLLMDMLADELR